jgi:voltage-gated potassium channel
VDLLLGIFLALEFLGRMLAHRHPMAYLDNGAAVVDLVVIASLFISASGSTLVSFGSCGRSGSPVLQRTGQLKKRFPAIRRNEEVIHAALNLAVFRVHDLRGGLRHPA